MNKKMKHLLATFCLLLCASAASAQTSHWEQVNPYDFQYDMSVFFTLQHGEGDGATTFANADLDNYEIAAFVNGELRGVGEWQTTEVGGETKKWGYIRIRSNVQSGETVTFKYYDKTEQKEKTVYGNTGKIDFGDQDKIGEASAPHGFDMDNNVLPGDANDDGKVNILDASLIVDYVLDPSIEGVNLDAADINSDGKVNILDASAIVDVVLGN